MPATASASAAGRCRWPPDADTRGPNQIATEPYVAGAREPALDSAHLGPSHYANSAVRHRGPALARPGRDLRDLGLDLLRHRGRDPDDSAVLHVGVALPHRRRGTPDMGPRPQPGGTPLADRSPAARLGDRRGAAAGHWQRLR